MSATRTLPELTLGARFRHLREWDNCVSVRTVGYVVHKCLHSVTGVDIRTTLRMYCAGIPGTTLARLSLLVNFLSEQYPPHCTHPLGWSRGRVSGRPGRGDSPLESDRSCAAYVATRCGPPESRPSCPGLECGGGEGASAGGISRRRDRARRALQSGCQTKLIPPVLS